MRRVVVLTSLFVIVFSTSIYAQDKVPVALEQRLVAFAEQAWNEWMKTGDIRSIQSMRVQEIVNDPPCGLVRFTTQMVCQQLSSEKRADYTQTLDNVNTLMMYRILSRQNVFDFLTPIGPALDSGAGSPEDIIAKSASLSAAESALVKQMTGMSNGIDEFRQEWSRYKELERLLLADHVRDYKGAENPARYSENTALINQTFKGEGLISKIDQLADSGLPAGGDYYLVQRGFFIFVVRKTEDEMRLAALLTIRK